MTLGLPVIESIYATVPGQPYPVRRSWRERWLTWPWHPFMTIRLVTPMVPTCYHTSFGLVAHPAVIASLRRSQEAPQEGEEKAKALTSPKHL